MKPSIPSTVYNCDGMLREGPNGKPAVIDTLSVSRLTAKWWDLSNSLRDLDRLESFTYGEVTVEF